MIRCHILYPIKDEPWGGGNQFLKALRSHLQFRDAYAESPGNADVILINGHHELLRALSLRRSRPEVAIVHRIDGILGLHRRRGGVEDALIHAFNSAIADATIFQSLWSRDASRRQGLRPGPMEAVIPNAPDPTIFFRAENSAGSDRLRLIACSWSTNSKKGFELYQYLDEHLDWDRFDMTFIGNSPVKFRRIRQLAAMASRPLAEELRAHHLYVTGCTDDACSNSLLEALSCGLPVAAVRSGGNPELVGPRGVLFDGTNDILPALDVLAANLQFYRASPPLPGLSAVGDGYLKVCEAAIQSPVRRTIDWWESLSLRLRHRRVLGGRT